MSSMLDDRFRKPVGLRPEMPCRLSYSSMPGTTEENESFFCTHSGNQREFLAALMCLFQEVGHFLQELVVDVVVTKKARESRIGGHGPGVNGDRWLFSSEQKSLFEAWRSSSFNTTGNTYVGFA